MWELAPEEFEYTSSNTGDLPAASSTDPAPAPLVPLLCIAKGKRLTKKTNPKGTPYFGIKVYGTKAEQRRRREEVRAVKKANLSAAKTAEAMARQVVANNSGRITELVDSEGQGDETVTDYSKTDAIHTSHDLKPVREDPNALYCTRCAAWTTGEAPKILKQMCSGHIKPGSAFQHRLLQLGIIPKPWARIPQHAKKKRKLHR